MRVFSLGTSFSKTNKQTNRQTKSAYKKQNKTKTNLISCYLIIVDLRFPELIENFFRIECRTHIPMFCSGELTVCHVVTRSRGALYVCCA